MAGGGRKGLAGLLALGFGLVAIFAPQGLAGRPATAMAAPGQSDSWESADLVPLTYDLEVAYDPTTCLLKVTADLEFRVQRDAPPGRYSFSPDTRYYTLGLNGDFQIECIEVAGSAPEWTRAPHRELGNGWMKLFVPMKWATAGQGGQAEQVSEIGSVKRVTVSYHGTPENYYAEQDRYWSRASSDALWLANPWDWLPYVTEGSDDRWAGTAIRLTMAVPADWRVLVPGLEPVAEETRDGESRYTFEGRAWEGAVPYRLVAGPYQLAGAGTGGGLPYTVWGLPGWWDTAEELGCELGPLLDFAAATLGELPEQAITFIQVPPEQGGGMAFPAVGTAYIGAHGTRNLFGGTDDLRELWMHELTHLLNPYLDEGIADFMGMLYLAERDPETWLKDARSKQRYFLGAARQHGDRAIAPTTLASWNGESIPEWHAFLYAKPALVWHMFRGLFGDKAAVIALRLLHREATQLTDWGSGAGWFDLVRRAMGEAAGPAGLAFYDRWFEEAYPLDLAVEDAVYRPVAATAGADGSGAGGSGDNERWEISFTVRDLHGDDVPPARTAVPWVEVAVRLEDGRQETRQVPLTSDAVPMSLIVPTRPLEVRLDPDGWLLDYDGSNNQVSPQRARTVLETILVTLPALGVLAGLAALMMLLRRRPARVSAPPPVGRAN